MFRSSCAFRNQATRGVVLFDATAIIHRAYHSWQYHHKDSRDPVDHVLKSLRTQTLNFARVKLPPTTTLLAENGTATVDHQHMLFCHDSGVRERCLEDPQYKAHRPEKPEVLQKVLTAGQAWCEEFAEKAKNKGAEHLVLSLPAINKSTTEARPNAGENGTSSSSSSSATTAAPTTTTQVNCEADDAMFTVCETMRRDPRTREVPILVVTHDHDLLQLMGTHTFFYHLGKKKFCDEAYVDKTCGVTSEQITDYKVLVGDESDNLTGVRGLGPKRAAKLLQKYGTLEVLLEKAPKELKGKAAERIAEGAAEALRLKKLMAMRTVTAVDAEVKKHLTQLSGVSKF